MILAPAPSTLVLRATFRFTTAQNDGPHGLIVSTRIYTRVRLHGMRVHMRRFKATFKERFRVAPA